jgi:lysozyme family protein
LTDRLAICLPVILREEGGWADRAGDPGGPTMDGVTLATFRDYFGQGSSVADLRTMSDAQREAVYRGEIWNPCHAAACPPGVDLMVFDAATNSGPSRAVRWLQQAVGVMADGKFGPQTAAALADANALTVITLYKNLRLTFLHALPTAGDDPGWFSRVPRVADLAAQWASA